MDIQKKKAFYDVIQKRTSDLKSELVRYIQSLVKDRREIINWMGITMVDSRYYYIGHTSLLLNLGSVSTLFAIAEALDDKFKNTIGSDTADSD